MSGDVIMWLALCLLGAGVGYAVYLSRRAVRIAAGAMADVAPHRSRQLAELHREWDAEINRPDGILRADTPFERSALTQYLIDRVRERNGVVIWPRTEDQ